MHWKHLQTYSRWIAVACLALVTFVLGYAGHREYYRAVGKQRSPIDLTYVTLQLFVMQGGDLDPPVNGNLEFARFAAPFVAAYAGFWAILSIFYGKVQLVRPWLIGDHVIICGLGRRGSKLVQQLRARGECVVVIEHDENNDQLAHCRQVGAIVLVGRANDRWLLGRAFVHRARVLIAIVGDDGVNVETAVLAHELNQKRLVGSLECIVHVFDPRLQEVLKRHRIFTDTTDPFVLRFFNAFELGARAMLRIRPLETLAAGRPPHVLVVGLGRLGESLLAQAAAERRAQQPHGEPMIVTVVDRHARLKQDMMRMRHPEVDAACRTRFLEMDVHFPEFPGRVVGGDDPSIPSVDIAYVCVDSDSLALFAALALRECLGHREVPIIVRMTEQTGLAALLSSDGGDGLIEGVHAVGLLDIACSLDLLLGKAPETPPARSATSQAPQ
jgi:hypothetical protein